ncbi:MAG: hypothetical protein LQ345_002211 [Seirophora villosa]|nr:MAG: hypothetical protein LQ345_002211 [Seirophora villosa]
MRDLAIKALSHVSRGLVPSVQFALRRNNPRHTENQLSIDGKWHRVACLACRAHVSKAQLRKLVWKEDFKRLDALAKLKSAESHPRYRSCLSSTCNSGQIHRPHSKPDPSIVVCKACGSRSCYRHRVPWHDGYTCKQYDLSHPSVHTTRSSEATVKRIAKRCPGKGCGVFIEKDGGCDSVYCPHCHLIFMWRDVKRERGGGAEVRRRVGSGEGEKEVSKRVSDGDGEGEVRRRVTRSGRWVAGGL